MKKTDISIFLELLTPEKCQERQLIIDEVKKEYKEIDKVLDPYRPVIREFRKTPAEAVSQLFQWFDSLAKDPDRAFPALIKAYEYDPTKLNKFLDDQ